MGKKGGGGGGGVPTVNVPAGTAAGAEAEAGLGKYATSLFDPVASMTNWAASLATGGAATPIQSSASTLSVAGPQVYFAGPKPWNSSFDPQTGLITFTGDNPAQTFTKSIADYTAGYSAGKNAEFGNIPVSQLAQWQKDYQQAQAKTSAGGAQAGQMPSMGPFLGQAWSELQQAQAATGQLSTIQQQTADFTDQADATAAQLMQEATTGSGLFPGQQAEIDQAVAAGKTQIASELGGAGLSQSTQAGMLGAEVDLAGAAEAGQLQQGNIQLAQAAQKIALGGQTLEAGEQAQLVTELTSIAGQSAQMQATLYQEALSGYGILGQMIGQSAQAYNYSLSGYGQELAAEGANVQAQTAMDNAAAAADAQGTSSLFQGLGSILGGGSGGSGGLLGGLGSGLGSLLGGGSGAAGAAVSGTAVAAGEAGVTAAGTSGLVSGIGTALTALTAAFCEVAIEVYGVDSYKWERFRTWLLTRGPFWLIRLYGRHANTVARWVSDKPVVKWALGMLMDLISLC